MPIKKHIVTIDSENKIVIPKSLMRVLKLQPGHTIKIYSNSDGKTLTISTTPQCSESTKYLLEKIKRYSILTKENI